MYRTLVTVIIGLLLCQCSQCRVISRSNDNETGCYKPADIVFVLDASNTIWPPDFRKQLQFVNSVIREFPIDPTMVRTGVITFSHVVRVEFGLKTHSSSETLSSAVSRVTQLGGNTYTHLALRRLRELFEEEGRKGVAHLGIIITDGLSDFPSNTAREAEGVRREGIDLFSIGVGNQTDSRELKDIAGTTERIFRVESYDGLGGIREAIAVKTCALGLGNGSTESIDHHIQNIQGCPDQPTDVLFILDSSRSITRSDFRRQLTFVKDTVALFPISDRGTHVAVLTFGDVPRSQFDLDRYSTLTDVQNAVERIVHQVGSTTDTAAALRYVRLNSFAGRSTRETAKKIVVVVTDGKSDDPGSTALEAKLLRGEGVEVFAIGVGSQVDSQELNAVASEPQDKHVFMAVNYASLGSIRGRLFSPGCLGSNTGGRDREEETEPHHLTMVSDGSDHLDQTKTDCLTITPADIVFALPSSIDDRDTTHGLALISSMATRINLGSNPVRFGLVPRVCHAISGFTLDEGLNGEQVSRYVNNQKPTGTVDEVASTLRYLRVVSYGERSIVQRRRSGVKMAVIVVDEANLVLRQPTIDEANRLKQKGIVVVVVSVGGKTTSTIELKDLAGCSECLMRAENYSSLSQVEGDLAKLIYDRICADKQ